MAVETPPPELGAPCPDFQLPAVDGGSAIAAVVPTITGRAWITGTAQYLLDPTDPFPAGFVL